MKAVTYCDVGDFRVAAEYRASAEALHLEWDREVERVYAERLEPLPSQAELIGAVPTKDLRLSRLAFFQRAPRLFHHVEETTNA